MHFYSWSKKACGIKIKLRNWTSKWSGNNLDLDSDQILKPIHSLGWIIWIAIFKRALSLSVLMLCVPVLILTSSSSALLGHPHCGLLIWLSLLAIFNTLFWVYEKLFMRKQDNTKILFESNPKMVANVYWVCKVLILRSYNLWWWSTKFCSCT